MPPPVPPMVKLGRMTVENPEVPVSAAMRRWTSQAWSMLWAKPDLADARPMPDMACLNLWRSTAFPRVCTFRLCRFRVGHDRGRVAVDQDGAEPFGLERLARLGAGIVELAGLPDDDGAGADDEDAFYVCTLGHGAMIISGRPSG